eukprot:8084653-Alexandrium_andersonii.AAC.1
MSASLVGSEMCIRDRYWTRSPNRIHPTGGLHPICATRSGLGSSGIARQAVSYTHLTLPTICSV